jgi:hypothetical protein
MWGYLFAYVLGFGSCFVLQNRGFFGFITSQIVSWMFKKDNKPLEETAMNMIENLMKSMDFPAQQQRVPNPLRQRRPKNDMNKYKEYNETDQPEEKEKPVSRPPVQPRNEEKSKQFQSEFQKALKELEAGTADYE